MKKRLNFPRVLWIACLFLELIVILIMVMDFKINYEPLHMKTNFLYFYECDNEVCVSEVEEKAKTLYNKYNCWYHTCPVYKKTIHDNYALLKEENSYILYDYIQDKTITSGYDDYQFINNDYVIVTKNGKKGIIDIEDNTIIEPAYDEIGYYKNDYLSGYNTSNILVKNNKKYGIVSFKDGKIIEELKYPEGEVNKLLTIIELGELQ